MSEKLLVSMCNPLMTSDVAAWEAMGNVVAVNARRTAESWPHAVSHGMEQ
jgi:hypothetical protein